MMMSAATSAISRHSSAMTTIVPAGTDAVFAPFSAAVSGTSACFSSNPGMLNTVLPSLSGLSLILSICVKRRRLYMSRAPAYCSSAMRMARSVTKASPSSSEDS